MSDEHDNYDDLAGCINRGLPRVKDTTGCYVGLCEKHFKGAHPVGHAMITDSMNGQHHLEQEQSLYH